MTMASCSNYTLQCYHETASVQIPFLGFEREILVGNVSTVDHSGRTNQSVPSQEPSIPRNSQKKEWSYEQSRKD
jgi:hypothetical protein